MKNELNVKHLDQHTFTEWVEKLVRKDKMRYSEAICEICNQMELESTDILHLITPALRHKIESQVGNKSTKSLATLAECF